MFELLMSDTAENQLKLPDDSRIVEKCGVTVKPKDGLQTNHEALQKM